MASSTFTIAFPLGVTVGKWTRVFEQRFPEVELSVVRMELDDQHRMLESGEADMAFVREPLDTDGLHVIPLYAEDIVVVMNHEHLLTLEKKLHRAELDGETVLTGDASEGLFRSVAGGAGVAVLPQSVAKVFRRKDVVAMKLEDAEPSQVGLAWPRDGQHPLVDEFIGIVRGRTAHSSRNPEVAATEAAQGKKAARKAPRQPTSDGAKGAKGAKSAGKKTAGKNTAGKKTAGTKGGSARGQVTRRARRGGA
ncbi:LysR substrate-binding domain-containing protein [Leifsonia sp. NPDC058248]|uniref:LysR family substrate-binding domain-containing protein n=1 Tax=Leifsonia sp. NPDC058248 TaxID=3346402 RepID=UPI0036D84AD8